MQHKDKKVIKIRQENCKFKQVRKACGCSCNGKSALPPTVAPPTATPPTVECIDDPKFKFTSVLNGNVQKCAWITKHKDKKVVKSRKENCRKNKQVMKTCKCACDGESLLPPTAAPCSNDPSFKFTAKKNGKTQKCDWIIKHRDQKTVDLRKENCENKQVKAACRLSCDNCK